MLSEMVVLVTESDEEELKILQSLHQHAGVRIEEAQGEPLQDQIQTADRSLGLRLQVLRKTQHVTADHIKCSWKFLTVHMYRRFVSLISMAAGIRPK